MSSLMDSLLAEPAGAELGEAELAGDGVDEPQAEHDEPEFDDAILLAAELLAEGYADDGVCQACEITADELALWRADGRLAKALGEAKRGVVAREQALDKQWDELEVRSLQELKLELADGGLMSVSEKLGIARAANAAKRRRDGKPVGPVGSGGSGSGGAVVVNQNTTVHLSLPAEIVKQIEGVVGAGGPEGSGLDVASLLAKEAAIEASVDPSKGHVGFEEAGRILGIDVAGSDREASAIRPEDAVVIEQSGSSFEPDGPDGLIASEPG